MTSSASILYVLALLVPVLSAPSATSLPAAPAAEAGAVLHAAPENPPPLGLRAAQPARGLRVLEEAHLPQRQNQVRIESRVIIRISPAPPAQRERMLATLPRRPITTTFAEAEHGDCVAVEAIAGSQPLDEDRILLFLRDRRVLSASLNRACNARDFYSGFYVEGNEDGKICVSRDRLMSRSGANCEVSSLRRLVAVRD